MKKSNGVLDTSERVIAHTETQFLPVKLMPDELMERGHQLAEAVQDLTTEENRQVDVKTQMKARLAEIDARKTQLAVAISRREEHRDVSVDIVHDFDQRLVEKIRQDTGEVIASRRMTEDELQVALPLKG